jgi:hypothetical protein
VIAASPDALGGTEWSVGWTLSADAAAAFGKNSDGVRLLLNPMTVRTYDPKSLFHYLLRTAAHEIAHYVHTVHDEAFVNHSEELHTRALIALDSWYNEYMASNNTAI